MKTYPSREKEGRRWYPGSTSVVLVGSEKTDQASGVSENFHAPLLGASGVQQARLPRHFVRFRRLSTT
jgi:hypothetical protein